MPDDKALRDDSRKKGMVAGVSSGAALHAALAVASRPETAGKMTVVLLADTGKRYITSALFAADASTGAMPPNHLLQPTGRKRPAAE